MARPPSQGWHVTGATSPKIYWHAVSSAVIKASGSRKAKGTGERGEGRNLTSPFLFNTKNKKRDGKRRSEHIPRFQLLGQARPLFAEEWETAHTNSTTAHTNSTKFIPI